MILFDVYKHGGARPLEKSGQSDPKSNPVLFIESEEARPKTRRPDDSQKSTIPASASY